MGNLVPVATTSCVHLSSYLFSQESVFVLALLFLVMWLLKGACGRPVNHRARIVLGVPWLLFLVHPFLEASFWYQSGIRSWNDPDPDDYLILYAVLAFGFVFSLRNYRLGSHLFRMNASLLTGLFGLAIIYEIFRLVNWIIRSLTDTYYDSAIFFVPILLIYVLIWARWASYAQARFTLQSVVKRGCCEACGYDLRGSGEHLNCLECGADVRRVRRLMRMKNKSR